MGPMRRFAAPLITLALLVAAVAGSPAPSGAATPSEPDRVAWRIKLPLDYFFHTPGIGPDGTIYVPNLYGRTQAVAPNGSTKWTFPAGGTGSPISVMGDGTVIVAGGGPGAVGGTDGRGVDVADSRQAKRLALVLARLRVDAHHHALVMLQVVDRVAIEQR